MPTSAARPVAPRNTLAQWVDARLRTAILCGELSPGTRLRSEHLAAQWGVSPTPVREAFQRLAGDGLVVIEPQRGASVAAIDARAAAEHYELRMTLDPIALRSSMEAADDTYRAAVANAYGHLVATHDDALDALAAHREFHLALLSRCTNQRLLQLCAQLHDQTQRYQVSGAGRQRASDPADEHRALYEAVIAGDHLRACALLSAHLQATLAAVRVAASATPPGDG